MYFLQDCQSTILDAISIILGHILHDIPNKKDLQVI